MSHSNKVILIGHYGGDKTHSQAAWTSTQILGKEERIPGLLKMLADRDHGTPFERSLLHFQVTCDQASHIHFLKHRIGVSINGESARYKEYINDKVYEPDDWPQTDKNVLWARSTAAFHKYHSVLKTLVDGGMDRKRAKESARYFLTMASQINLDMSFNFRSFVHFQKLRNSEDAQLEIRTLAQEMLRLVKKETNDSFRYSLEAWNL